MNKGMKQTILLTVLLASCGSGATPRGVPLGKCGAHGMEQADGSCACGAGYTGAACDTPPPPPPATCTPQAFLCDSAEIRQCGSDGLTKNAMVIKDCSADALLTECAPCSLTGAPACQAPMPTCSGLISGLSTDPVPFTDSGCGSAATCEATLGADNAVFSATIPGVGDINWNVADWAAVNPGISFPLNVGDGKGSNNFRLTVAGYSNDWRGQPDGAPRAGSVKLTFSATTPGSPLTLDVEGPLVYTDLKIVKLHIVTVWN